MNDDSLNNQMHSYIVQIDMFYVFLTEWNYAIV